MKNISKILAIAALILSFYTLYAARCTLCYAAGEQHVAVSVNGENILDAEVQMAVNRLIPASVYHGRVSNEKLEQLRKSAIDSLVEWELLYHEGKRLGLGVKKSEVKEVFNKNKESFKKKQDFYKELGRLGLTEESYKKLIEKELITRKFLKQEVEDKVQLSEADLQDYYNKNKDKFVSPDKIRLREILIGVSPTATAEEKEEIRKKAEGLLKKIKAGEDFGDLAYNHSEDAFRVKGGDLGMSHKGRLMPELEEAASLLGLGEVSGLIETINGYHIIKLEGKEEARQLDFSEVKGSLKKELEAKRYKEAREALTKPLKEKAKIEIY